MMVGGAIYCFERDAQRQCWTLSVLLVVLASKDVLDPRAGPRPLSRNILWRTIDIPPNI